MASQKITNTRMTHKDGKPRKKLVRTRLIQNGKSIDLKKLAARRTLVARR